MTTTTTPTRYAIAREVDLSFEEAERRAREALQAEGFGVLTEIDVKATLKKKLDVDVPRYTILGACNPPLAHRAIGADPHIGLLLPCNVVVRETVGGTAVEAVDPVVQMEVADVPGLEEIATEVRNRLRRVIAAI